MSALLIQPSAHAREQGSVGAPRGQGAARSARKISLVGFLLAACLVGCNSDKGIGIEPVATPSSPGATPSPTPVDEQQAILSQYRRFWSSLTPVSKMPASQRRAALARYTVDPELKSLLAGLLKTDAKKQVFYGAHVPRATQASLSSYGRAVIDDCQDSSRTGLARLSDMAPLTKGVARNHVVVTMKMSGDLWKVYFVSYTKSPC
jgi:hypothetical protein